LGLLEGTSLIHGTRSSTFPPFHLRTEGGTVFETCSVWNTRQWKRSSYLVILNVIYRYQKTFRIKLNIHCTLCCNSRIFRPFVLYIRLVLFNCAGLRNWCSNCHQNIFKSCSFCMIFCVICWQVFYADNRKAVFMTMVLSFLSLSCLVVWGRC
jgi:hypothetical protein